VIRKVVILLNKHPMGCEAQLAWKYLSRPLFFGGWFWSV